MDAVAVIVTRALAVRSVERASREQAAGEVGAKARRLDVLDDEAFRRVYTEHGPPVSRYLRRIAADDATADDLVQEVFVRYLCAPPSSKDEGGLRSYLFRIATRLVIDHARSERRFGFADELDEERLEGVPDPDAGRALDLRRTFRTLGARERALLWLAHVEELSHAEIAKALGVGAVSVRVLLFRARRKLARELERAEAVS